MDANRLLNGKCRLAVYLMVDGWLLLVGLLLMDDWLLLDDWLVLVSLFCIVAK